MKTIALFGGSFNPPHVGHQIMITWVLSTGQADKVVVVPCFKHPFEKRLESFTDRFEMCSRMILDFPIGMASVSTIEERMGGVSWTINTVKKFKEENPDKKIKLIIGSDTALVKDNWHKYDEVNELVDFIVIERNGYPYDNEAPQISSISSTEVRNRIENGKDTSKLIPYRVAGYIGFRKLYEGAK